MNEYRNSLLTSRLLLCISIACLGSLQFGYHIAELNAPQQVLSCSEFSIPSEHATYDETWLGSHGLVQCIPLSNTQIGWITSIFSLGGLLGSFYAGSWADHYGRKKVSIASSVVVTIGSLVLFYSNTYLQLLIGRTIVGIACGVYLVITPLYINEIAPAQHRGALGAMNQVAINLGILLTQLLALRYTDSFRWRWLFFAGVVLGLLTLVMWWNACESPLWMAQRGKFSVAETTLLDLRGRAALPEAREEAREELQGRMSVALPEREGDEEAALPNANATSNKPPSLWQYATGDQYKTSRNIIAVVLVAQQLVGINAVVFYGVRVVAQLVPERAVHVAFGVSVVNLVATAGVATVLDRVTRRTALAASAMGIALGSVGVAAGLVGSHAGLLVWSLVWYIAAFACGMGPVPFLMVGEVARGVERATAQSYGTVCNWLATFAVGLLFPVAHDLLGGWVFAGFAVVSVAFAWWARREHHAERSQHVM
ncbi:hypothetical protein TBLA_0B04640 [Henningerozyma blattae CBS 6284]|uniref:Major facilitator superfamily (MFS) profile domain-containing protein n=1 Tax=Henningerozyma blattae (strain ATCC 34711 / CBS 6284 / DSM 70876 / NBRC 10599 / NRRL Y-10934 / UCD 77-7) TaxID=1071380 RepID=I2GYU8_HENB6|nr:hypothetical protein TBLA_0B04640 [Tetrapisispora blattae CBS 6284]CCH59300.1 hypothetical protein TBLA_0B04640 [Tetrapisispora blattae CBS 6284]